MATKKKPSKKPIPIPFPAEHFEAHVDAPKEIPAPPVSEPPEFKVACKVTSVATTFWNATVFVALEATDGQNLLELLRKDQTVVLHYVK